MFLSDRVKCILILFLLNSCAVDSANMQANQSISSDSNWEHAADKIIVKDEEDWQILAKRYQIPVSLLQRFNHKKDNYKIRSGDELAIPAKSFHQVKSGETSLGLALKYGLTFSEFVSINELTEPYDLKIGKKIKIIEVNLLKEIQKINKIARINNEPKSNDLSFAWPVAGNLIAKFGLQANGVMNDGILLSTAPHAAIRAVNIGEVAYIGNEVGNYGNLVIIQHNDNWFSSYAHLEKIIVKKGDSIKRGQVIGYMGEIGEHNMHDLYFSLRKSANPVDPLKYLPKKHKRKK